MDLTARYEEDETADAFAATHWLAIRVMLPGLTFITGNHGPKLRNESTDYLYALGFSFVNMCPLVSHIPLLDVFAWNSYLKWFLISSNIQNNGPQLQRTRSDSSITNGLGELLTFPPSGSLYFTHAGMRLCGGTSS